MHEIETSRIPAALGTRIRQALESETLLANTSGATTSMGGRIFVALLGLGGLAFAVGYEFGSPYRGIQPLPFLALYAISLWFIIAQVFGRMRENRKKAATTFPQGMWLLPMDVVKIDGGVMQVWPLTEMLDLGATHQHYNGQYSFTEFVFQFPDTSHRFVQGNQAAAEQVMQRLQGTRAAIAAAVEAGDLQTLVGLDPLFELRTKEFKLDAPAGPSVQRAEPVPGWLKKSKTSALVAGVALGFVLMFARNYVSDGAAFEAAKQRNSVWAYEAYIRQGGRMTPEVEAEHLPLARLDAVVKETNRKKLDAAKGVLQTVNPLRISEVASVKKRAEEVWALVHEDALEQAAKDGVAVLRRYRDEMEDETFTAQAKAKIHEAYVDAKKTFTDQAQTGDPTIIPFFTKLLDMLEKNDDPRVWVRFRSPTTAVLEAVDTDNAKRKKTPLEPTIEPVASHFDLESSTSREKVIVQMLGRGFGAILASDVLDLTMGPRLDDEAKVDGPSIEVSYIILPSGATYTSSKDPTRGFVGIQINFAVAMKLPGHDDDISFDLKVEPPETFSVNYETRAFLTGVPGQGASAGVVYSVMAAQAFQKLAGELRTRIFKEGSKAFGSFKAAPPTPVRPVGVGR